MRKIFIILCIALIVIMSGCGDKTAQPALDSNITSKIRADLELIPKEYSSDTALKDGCFVVENDKLKSKIDIMNTFISDSQSGKEASITIVQYTKQGDPIIAKVIYDGEKYYGVEDDTRDSQTSTVNKIFWDFEFKYIKAYEKNNRMNFYLVNDENRTLDDIIKSLLSSKTFDRSVQQFLCSYEK